MIRREEAGVLWRLVIDRPDKANSLTAPMLEALIGHLDAARDAGVAALLLTGTGKVFSAGADLEEAKAGLATSPLWIEASQRLADLPALTVAALNGTLAGGAFNLALACDIRLGVPGARFFYPVMKLGYLPQPADPARLAALVGPGRAKLILMAGQRIEADEALAWGLLDRLVSAEALAEAAEALCADACAAPAGHPGRIKAMFPGA
ncbi:MAG: enoyl-CoA hydratase/isomerase family protein [Pararhodobacter sp.]